MAGINGFQPKVACVGVHPIGQAQGVALPVMVVPIIYRLAKYPNRVLRWPQPLYLQYKGPLCRQHALAFSMKDYEEYITGDATVGIGGWYQMVGDHLRSNRKPATNPFPGDPSFEWNEWIINPNWEPAPKEECTLQMWDVRTMWAKGMRQPLW